MSEGVTRTKSAGHSLTHSLPSLTLDLLLSRLRTSFTLDVLTTCFSSLPLSLAVSSPHPTLCRLALSLLAGFFCAFFVVSFVVSFVVFLLFFSCFAACPVSQLSTCSEARSTLYRSPVGRRSKTCLAWGCRRARPEVRSHSLLGFCCP